MSRFKDRSRSAPREIHLLINRVSDGCSLRRGVVIVVCIAGVNWTLQALASAEGCFTQTHAARRNASPEIVGNGSTISKSHLRLHDYKLVGVFRRLLNRNKPPNLFRVWFERPTDARNTFINKFLTELKISFDVLLFR